ncbi:hypothetical protein [Halobacillus ihumii]|uniref:hypothetical protein n=1 Tax=Halobacillus ihumii TaxID=2686092 RepID=UPI0013D054F6|nr:hypothetical protein [Halobacillus ihumii]
MAFAVFFFAAWLLAAIFFVMPKKLTLIENLFVILLILLININWTWIIYEGLKFIKITKDPMLYTSFLLYRSVITPVLLIMQLNWVHQSASQKQSILVMMASIITLALFTGLSLLFDMTSYVKWNIGYDILYFAVLHFIAYYAHYFYRKVSYGEVDYS